MADKLVPKKIKTVNILLGTYSEGAGIQFYDAVRDGYIVIKAPLTQPERTIQGNFINLTSQLGMVVTCKVNAYSGAYVAFMPVNAGDTVKMENFSGVTSVGLEIYN